MTSNPHDRAARNALLDYYFLNPRLDPAKAIPARRRHILWLIEHAPADPMAGDPSATIDLSGHRADAQGFKQASDAWRARIARSGINAAALAEGALRRAVSLAPNDRDVASYQAEHRAIQREIQAAPGTRGTR